MEYDKPKTITRHPARPMRVARATFRGGVIRVQDWDRLALRRTPVIVSLWENGRPSRFIGWESGRTPRHRHESRFRQHKNVADLNESNLERRALDRGRWVTYTYNEPMRGRGEYVSAFYCEYSGGVVYRVGTAGDQATRWVKDQGSPTGWRCICERPRQSSRSYTAFSPELRTDHLRRLRAFEKKHKVSVYVEDCGKGGRPSDSEIERLIGDLLSEKESGPASPAILAACEMLGRVWASR